KISGKITDETDLPLPGVNIILKGTTNGTTSDSEGNFTIEVPDGDAVLVFSFIGYATQEVTVGSQTLFNVKMVADITSLDEVVVVGYGQQKKSSLTVAIGTLQGEDIETR